MASDSQQPAADPFAGQREPGEDPFAAQKGDEVLSDTAGSMPSSPTSPRDRRASKEWDASKVPPSQFQKRKGSLYSTPGSRDGHVDSSKTRDKSFHDKLKEKGWFK